jgi:pimeloyl-ACP methyl ester carboxylesterase
MTSIDAPTASTAPGGSPAQRGRQRRLLLAAAAALLVGAPLALFASLRAGWWATDLDAVRAKHAGPPARFITIDGVELHVRDEGQGPAVVLLHGSIVNLRQWDPVVERLEGRFRVVRVDWPPYGFSGLDPSGVYTTARAAELVAGLVDHLGLERFGLVATSNGANVALEYNARHPGRVGAMALSVLPLERPSQTRAVDARIRALGWFHSRWLPDWRSKAWFRMIIEDTTPPAFEAPEAMVEAIYDANNLPGALQRQRDYIASNTRLFKTSDMGASAALVTVPVLLQWCEQDTVISQTPERSIARFTGTTVKLVRYPQLGHFPMWEDPDTFTADLAAFLDETLR